MSPCRFHGAIVATAPVTGKNQPVIATGNCISALHLESNHSTFYGSRLSRKLV
jgi:hypothetical protein